MVVLGQETGLFISIDNRTEYAFDGRSSVYYVRTLYQTAPDTSQPLNVSARSLQLSANDFCHYRMEDPEIERVFRCAGENDPWVRSWWARRLKRRVPTADYFAISPAGHCPHHEAPNTVNHLIRAWIAAKVSVSVFCPFSTTTVAILGRLSSRRFDLSSMNAQFSWNSE
jgi:hypothetical protein